MKLEETLNKLAENNAKILIALENLPFYHDSYEYFWFNYKIEILISETYYILDTLVYFDLGEAKKLYEKMVEYLKEASKYVEVSDYYGRVWAFENKLQNLKKFLDTSIKFLNYFKYKLNLEILSVEEIVRNLKSKGYDPRRGY